MAFILAVISALLVYSYLGGLQPTASKGDSTLVIAKVEILPSTQITADMVEAVNIPSHLLQPGAMTDINAVVGVYSKERILPKEHITERLLTLEGRAAGFPGMIPRDKRAITIAVTDVTGVAGLLKPGDYVDVIVTLEGSEKGDSFSSMTIQNALILAANKVLNREDKASEGKEGHSNSTVTLALPPDDATMLALAGVKGQIHLALRPFPQADSAIAQIEVKTIQSLRGDAPPVTYSPVAASSDSGNSTKTISVIRGTKADSVPVR